MKTLRSGLSALGLAFFSLSSYADLVPLPPLPFPSLENSSVTVPSFPGGADFTIEGVYLETVDSNLSYQTLRTSSNPLTPFLLGSQASIGEEFNYGFLLGTGYTFPDSGNDIHLNWLHLETGILSGPRVSSQSTIAANTLSTLLIGESSLGFDVANLQFGQTIDFGSHLISNIYTGVRYVNFGRDFTETARGEVMLIDDATLVFLTSTDKEQTESTYQGIGPVAGISASYSLFNGFHLTGEFASALLIGQTTARGNEIFTFTNSEADDASEFAQGATSASKLTKVVPALDAKLGIDYAMTLNSGFGLILAGGYQVDHYFKALNRVGVDAADVILANIPNGFVAFTPVTPLIRRTSDISFHGPYVSLTAVL